MFNLLIFKALLNLTFNSAVLAGFKEFKVKTVFSKQSSSHSRFPWLSFRSSFTQVHANTGRRSHRPSPLSRKAGICSHHSGFGTDNVSARSFPVRTHRASSSFPATVRSSSVRRSHCSFNQSPTHGYLGCLPLIFKKLGYFFLSLKNMKQTRQPLGWMMGTPNASGGTCWAVPRSELIA